MSPRRQSRLGGMLWLLSLGLVAATAWPAPTGLTLAVDAPGNLLAADTPATVHLTNAPGPCAWRLLDLDGAPVATGTATPVDGAAAVPLPALPHGYYEFTCESGGSSRTLHLGVVTDHSGQAPAAGPLNVDAAAAWLTKPEQFDTVARMLRRMGIGWVRERFSWHWTERRPNQPDPRQYPAMIAAYSRQGVRVYEIFHDSPDWTHAGNAKTKNPGDLRYVYRFARRVATQYRGQVQAWEVWNEPDISFWPDLSDTYAGVLKAAYLGLKAADPTLPVLCGSFCRGVCEFDHGLLESGAADYFDIFNWHIYARPETYAGVLRSYLDVLAPFGAADRPVWLTEAGIHLNATGPDGELTRADERRQAEFIPRSFACSLAAGTDRHFFFVFPHYLERGIQFGATHRDLSPRPACVAIAAAVDLLGQARYRGQLKLGEAPEVQALAFDSGRGNVLVVWADQSQEIKLDVAAPTVTVADLYGKRRTVTTADGQLTLTVGPQAQYVIGVGERTTTGLTGPVRAPGKLPRNHPSPVIVRGQLQVTALDKDRDSYLIGGEPCQYVVEAYNFSDTPVAGTVAVEAPPGWQVTPAEVAMSLGRLGRATAPFTITPGRPAAGLQKLIVRPRFAGRNVAPSVSRLRFDYSRLPPVASEDLGFGDAARWVTNIPTYGQMAISATEGGVRFDIHFSGTGDRWCYPRVLFDPPRDCSAWDGLAFEYRCHAASPKTTVRLQVIEASGAHYLCGPIASTGEWQTAALRFADLTWGSFSAADPDGKLDPAAIAAIMIGGNTTEDDIWLEVRRVRLVRW